jgi:ribosomal protein S18 acetylase RimI-like enzyme
MLAPMVFDLGPADAEAAESFLLRTPELNLPLLAALERGGDRILCSRGPGGLEGMALLQEGDALAVASPMLPAAAEALGAAVGALGTVETLLAEQRSAPTLWRAMHGNRRPRLLFEQALLRITAEDMGPYTDPRLRHAHPGELAEICRMATAMFVEEVGMAPAEELLRAHVEQELEAGSIWVGEEGGALVFLVQVATRCAAGVELQRVYTEPEHRRRGIATLALGQICRTLLGSIPRVTLRVNESNTKAQGLYRKLGFERCAEMTLYCA